MLSTYISFAKGNTTVQEYTQADLAHLNYKTSSKEAVKNIVTQEELENSIFPTPKDAENALNRFSGQGKKNVTSKKTEDKEKGITHYETENKDTGDKIASADIVKNQDGTYSYANFKVSNGHNKTLALLVGGAVLAATAGAVVINSENKEGEEDEEKKEDLINKSFSEPSTTSTEVNSSNLDINKQ